MVKTEILVDNITEKICKENRDNVTESRLQLKDQEKPIKVVLEMFRHQTSISKTK